MRTFIKYFVSVLFSAGIIFFAVKHVGVIYADSMNSYVENINADVQAKREALLSKGVFRDGITINGISVSGMTVSEARNVLAPIEEGLIGDIGFKIEYGDDKELIIDRDYFTITYNTDDILAEAIMLASDGELESLRQQIDDLAKNGQNYDIECNITADIDRITEEVREVSDALNVEPVNATFKANPKSVYNGGDRFSYVEGKNGFRAKTEEAIEELTARIKNKDYGTIVIEGEVVEPDVKVSDLKGKLVKRSYYQSGYGYSPYNASNRVSNIKKACGIVNGSVIRPGSTFSINACLGPRTEGRGWLPAPGFINGGANSVDSPGGGVCHVSSTLYNAVIRADLQIVYRINHSSHVGYVPWGLDATIDTNGPDFKFANNTDTNAYIFMWVDTNKQCVCCEIWGERFPSRFDKIDFYAELVETIEPTDVEYVVDSTLSAPNWYVKNTAKTGYKYQSYKQYYKNGSPVGGPKEVATSIYRMHPKRICVWSGFNPAVDTLSASNRVSPPSP